MTDEDFAHGIERLVGNYTKVPAGLIRELRQAFGTWTAADWDRLVTLTLENVKHNPRLAHFHELAPQISRTHQSPSGGVIGCGECTKGYLDRYVLVGPAQTPYSEVYPCSCNPLTPRWRDGPPVERNIVTREQFLARHREIWEADEARKPKRIPAPVATATQPLEPPPGW